MAPALRLALSALLAASALAATATSSEAYRAWQQPAVLVAPPAVNNLASTGVGRDGEGLVAWSSRDPGESKFYGWVGVQQPGQALDRKKLALDGRHSRLVVARDGTAVAAWTVDAPGDSPDPEDRIDATIREPGGSFGDPVKVVGSEGFNNGPNITGLAASPNGTVAVSYVQLDTRREDSQLFASVRPPGGDFGAPIPLTDKLPITPLYSYGGGLGAVDAVTDSGKLFFHSEPERETTPHREVWIGTWTPGSGLPPLTRVSDPANEGYGGSVAVDDQGRAAVVWKETPPDIWAGDHWEVWAPGTVKLSWLSPSGDISQPVTVPGAEEMAEGPQLGMAADGVTIIAYHKYVGDNTYDYGPRLVSAPFGEHLPAAQKVGGLIASDEVQLAVSPSGYALVGWVNWTKWPGLAVETVLRKPDGEVSPPQDVRLPCPRHYPWLVDLAVNDNGEGAVALVPNTEVSVQPLEFVVDRPSEEPPHRECGTADIDPSTYPPPPPEPPVGTPPPLPPTTTPITLQPKRVLDQHPLVPAVRRVELRRLALSRRTFRIARSRARGRHRRGTTFSYEVSAAGRLELRLERRRVGRRTSRGCVPPKRRLRSRRRCVRWVKVGTVRYRASAGKGRSWFSGWVRGHRLRPGRYRAVAQAVSSTRRSGRRTVGFRVIG